MSTEIGSFNEMMKYAKKVLGSRITESEAKEHGIESYDLLVEETGDERISIADIEDIIKGDDDIYEEFATIAQTEYDKEHGKTEDEEKEEQTQVKGKSEAGV